MGSDNIKISKVAKVSYIDGTNLGETNSSLLACSFDSASSGEVVLT